MADMFRIMSLCGEQFGSSIGFPQYVDLQYRIVKLFLPKFVFPDVLQHKVIGLRTKSGKLAAFADVSLQPSSGTTDALMSRSYNDRLKTYGSEKLNPYLCNFLVAPEFRRQGLGKQLLRACEEAALSFGKRDLYLHVEKKELPALCLYLGSGFESLPIDGSTGSEVVFMRKVLKTSQ
jgi:GNAT superfamily N-acetyltransferase